LNILNINLNELVTNLIFTNCYKLIRIIR